MRAALGVAAIFALAVALPRMGSAFASERRTRRVVLKLRYDGKPVVGLDGRLAIVRLGPLNTAEPTEVSIAIGEVRLDAVPPDVERASIVIDADPRVGLGYHSRGLPGDLVGDIENLGDPRRDEAIVDVDLVTVMGLREPEDTRGGIACGSDAPLPRLSSPVYFEWDPVPGAIRYAVVVQVYSNGEARVVATDVVSEPSWLSALPVSATDESYLFSVNAWGCERQLGRFDVNGHGWWAWHYKFLVNERRATAPSAETWLMLPPALGLDSDLAAPMNRWCAYAEFGSRNECIARREALWRMHAFGYRGFHDGRSRCVAASEVGLVSYLERVRSAVLDSLSRALAGRAAVVEARWSSEVVRSIVVRPDGARTRQPVLVVDVDDDTTSLDRDIRLAFNAGAGIPEYWRVYVPRGDAQESLEQITEPDVPTRRYGRSSSIGGAYGQRIKVTSFPGVTIDFESIIPHRCP